MQQGTQFATDDIYRVRKSFRDLVLSSNVMRRIFAVLVAGLSVLASPSRASDLEEAFRELRITVPQQRLAAPDFTLQTPAGQPLRLSDYHGQLILLNFWASYCAPCRAEMPAMQALWRRYRERGLVILAVAADRGSPAPVQGFIESLAIDFPVLLDVQGMVRERYQVAALPTSYLIGRDGRFLGRVLGARDWDAAALRQLVADLLRSQPQ